MLTTKTKLFDTFVIIATTSSSITLFFTGYGLIVRGLAIGNEVAYEIVMQKNNQDKKTI